MKKYTSLLGTLVLAAWLCGCATFETNTYRTIGTSAVAVDTAMNGWGQYVRDGRATDAQQAKVRAAYERYQQSMRTVQSLVAAYHAAPANKPLLDQALIALQQAVFLLQQFTTANP